MSHLTKISLKKRKKLIDLGRDENGKWKTKTVNMTKSVAKILVKKRRRILK